MKTEYRSAVDWWLGAILVTVPIVMLSAGILALYSAPLRFGLYMLGVGVLVAVLVPAFSIPCRYTLTDERLIIRCGLLKEEIDLKRIQDAKPSSSAWAAPALSLKRVAIFLSDGGYRLVSPKQREEFIAELKRKKNEAA